MQFIFDETKDKKKFAWLPVCISENQYKSVWIWLESYSEKVIKRYGLGGVIYARKSKSHEGTAKGWAG